MTEISLTFVFGLIMVYEQPDMSSTPNKVQLSYQSDHGVAHGTTVKMLLSTKVLLMACLSHMKIMKRSL